MNKLINISDVSRKLNLINPKTKKPLNYILRFWEKEFTGVRPKILNNRRYYTNDQIEKIKLIKYLLKDKGLTIKGAKIVLNSKINKLDEYNSDSLKADYYKNNLKVKSKQILDKLKNLKKYGKKNSS